MIDPHLSLEHSTMYSYSVFARFDRAKPESFLSTFRLGSFVPLTSHFAAFLEHVEQVARSKSVHPCCRCCPLHNNPGMTALRVPTSSLPNFLIYHCLPWIALGSMVEISLSKKDLAGTQFHPPTSQKPAHSIHSQR